MIVLDTHIWIWWVHDEAKLTQKHIDAIKNNESGGIGISSISCWEVAKLVEYKRLVLPCPLEDWFGKALAYPGIKFLDLTPEIAVESTRLPEFSHRDPADQIIIATARIHNCPLITLDKRILAYPHVQLI